MPVFMLIVGTLLLAAVLWHLLQCVRSPAWPTAPGTVLDVKIIPRTFRDTSTYETVVSYQYRVGNNDYTSHRVMHSLGYDSNKKTAHQIASRFSNGQSVPVFHHPRLPAYSVLLPGIPGRGNLLIYGVVALIGVALVVNGAQRLHGGI